MHRLADQVFAQHRPEHRLAVANARERRAPGPLEMDIAPAARPVDHLADQQRAAIAELGREATELVPGIGHGERRGTPRAFGTGEDRCPGLRIQRARVEPELRRQRPVQPQHSRCRNPGAPPRHVEAFEVAGIAVVEAEVRLMHGHRETSVGKSAGRACVSQRRPAVRIRRVSDPGFPRRVPRGSAPRRRGNRRGRRCLPGRSP